MVALALRVGHRLFRRAEDTGAAGPECLNHVTFMLGTTSRLTAIGLFLVDRIVGQPHRQFERCSNLGSRGGPWIPVDRTGWAAGWKRSCGGTDPIAIGQLS